LPVILALFFAQVQIILYLQHSLIQATPPDVIPVSNAVGQGDYTGHGELSPHADHQWTPQPYFGSLLYAIELPEDGGQTSWFNTIKAYNPFARPQNNKGTGGPITVLKINRLLDMLIHTP
jgi:alpha-ketoglutarate-dependent taurine dioxygenase